MSDATAAERLALPELVLKRQATIIFGLTDRAIEGKIARGQWVEGRQYHRAPDGAIWINVPGVQRWVKSGRDGA